MRHFLAGWMAWFWSLFGQCKRCTRTSMIAAISAWGLTLLALIVSRRPEIAIGAGVLAIGFTGLWIAHLVGLASRGTVGSILRQLGAEPDEAKAIIGALPKVTGPHGHDGGRLKEGETINARFAPRSGRPGLQLTRVVIANDQGVTAAVSLSEGGSYIALDPRSMEPQS